MIWLIICAVVWLAGIPVAYKKYISKWEDHVESEKKYFSIIWPLTLLLYLIHFIHTEK